MQKDRINLYENWMYNLSFFEYHNFIIDNIDTLWKLTNYILNDFKDFNKENNYLNIEYPRINLNETITLTQEFFDNHNFDINIKELIKDKVLTLNKNIDKETNDYYNTKSDGISTYDENQNRFVTVNLEETLYDSAVLIHELLHYLNQPISGRNETSDLLTEAISYAGELIFFEDLNNKELTKKHNICLEKTMYTYANNIYYIYKLINLYKTKQSLSEEKYNELYKDNNYEFTINRFEEYISNKGSIYRDTWFMLGLPLSIYLLEEYKKDNDNFNYIHLLNNNINKKDINECLNLINFNKESLKESFNTFRQDLNNNYSSTKQYKKTS